MTKWRIHENVVNKEGGPALCVRKEEDNSRWIREVEFSAKVVMKVGLGDILWGP